MYLCKNTKFDHFCVFTFNHLKIDHLKVNYLKVDILINLNRNRYFDYFLSDIQYMFNLFIFSPTHEKKLSLNSVKLLSIIPLDPWSLHLIEILRYLYWLLKMVIKWLFIFEFYFFPTVCRNLWTMSTSFYRTHIHKNFCYFFKVLEIHTKDILWFFACASHSA